MLNVVSAPPLTKCNHRRTPKAIEYINTPFFPCIAIIKPLASILCTVNSRIRWGAVSSVTYMMLEARSDTFFCGGGGYICRLFTSELCRPSPIIHRARSADGARATRCCKQADCICCDALRRGEQPAICCRGGGMSKSVSYNWRLAFICRSALVGDPLLGPLVLCGEKGDSRLHRMFVCGQPGC